MRHVTAHAKERLKERMGTPKQSAERVATKALEHGLRHGETAGSLKRYLDGLYLAEGKAGHMRIYAGCVFLFTTGDTLITVLQLPSRYRKTVEKLLAQREEAAGC